MVDFHGFHVGIYASPMDPMEKRSSFSRKIHDPRVQIVPPISQGLTKKTAQSLVKHQPIFFSYHFPKKPCRVPDIFVGVT